MSDKGYPHESRVLKPYRILYIQPYNWMGGPHESLKALVSNLDKSQFSPLIILAGPSVAAEEFSELGVKVCFDPAILMVPRSLSPIRHIRYWLATWASARRLAKLIQRENVRLVHVNAESCWVGGFASKIARVPTVTHLRGLRAVSPIWVGWITTWVLNKFNQALVATSDAVKRAYFTSGARPELLSVIHNGVDVSAFDPQSAKPTLRSELAIKDGQPLIGMIANLDPRKGHGDFIVTCARVRDQIPGAEFVVVGDTSNGGEYYQQIRHLVTRHGMTEKIHFLGPRRDVPNILKSLDVVVQPSLTEAGPRVPIEAMAMERPIVVTDVGGNSEEIQNGQTGLVVPVGDVPSLTNAILRLLSDPQSAQRMGKAGRQRVLSMFTQEIHVQRVQELYFRLLFMDAHGPLKDAE